MARPKSIDNSKVFDVSKPGNGKPISTSRPVIVNHDNLVKDNSVVTAPSAPPLQPPSVIKKVIKPLNIKSETEKPAANIKLKKTKEVAQETKPDTAPEVSVEPAVPDQLKEAEPEVTSAAKAANEEVAASLPEDDKEVEAQPAEKRPADPEESNSANEESANNTESEEATSSEAASVDAVASEAQKRKKDTKEDAEQAKMDAKVAELVASKQYIVPLAHDSSKHGKKHTVVFMLLFLILLAIAAYVLIDAGLIDVGVQVPFELIRE